MIKTSVQLIFPWHARQDRPFYFRWGEGGDLSLPNVTLQCEATDEKMIDLEFSEALAVEKKQLPIPEYAQILSQVRPGALVEFTPPFWPEPFPLYILQKSPDHDFSYEMENQKHFGIILGQHFFHIVAADVVQHPFEKMQDARSSLQTALNFLEASRS